MQYFRERQGQRPVYHDPRKGGKAMEKKKPRTQSLSEEKELAQLLAAARRRKAGELQIHYIRTLWEQVLALSRDLEGAKKRLDGLPEQEEGAQAGRYARALQTCAHITLRLDQLRRQLYQAAHRGDLFDEAEGGLHVVWEDMPPPRGPRDE